MDLPNDQCYRLLKRWTGCDCRVPSGREVKCSRRRRGDDNCPCPTPSQDVAGKPYWQPFYEAGKCPVHSGGDLTEGGIQQDRTEQDENPTQEELQRGRTGHETQQALYEEWLLSAPYEKLNHEEKRERKRLRKAALRKADRESLPEILKGKKHEAPKDPEERREHDLARRRRNNAAARERKTNPEAAKRFDDDKKRKAAAEQTISYDIQRRREQNRASSEKHRAKKKGAQQTEQVTRDPQYSDSTTIAGLEHGMQRTTIGPSYPIPAIAPTARPPLPASKTARQAMTSGTGRLAPAPPRGPTPPPPRVPMPPPPPQVPRSGDRPHLNPNFALEVGPQIPMPLPQADLSGIELTVKVPDATDMFKERRRVRVRAKAEEKRRAQEQQLAVFQHQRLDEGRRRRQRSENSSESGRPRTIQRTQSPGQLSHDRLSRTGMEDDSDGDAMSVDDSAAGPRESQPRSAEQYAGLPEGWEDYEGLGAWSERAPSLPSGLNWQTRSQTPASRAGRQASPSGRLASHDDNAAGSSRGEQPGADQHARLPEWWEDQGDLGAHMSRPWTPGSDARFPTHPQTPASHHRGIASSSGRSEIEATPRPRIPIQSFSVARRGGGNDQGKQPDKGRGGDRRGGK